MVERHFSVGVGSTDPSEFSRLIGEATHDLVAGRSERGTWGGPDRLDEFIATTHCAMALLATGYSASGPVLRDALAYLVEIDTNAITTFYWRSGPLLNVVEYADVVRHDAQHLARLMERAGGNPSYPAPFFLYKLLKFWQIGAAPPAVDAERVAQWIRAEWNEDECWYGRTSITSMGVALLVDTGKPEDVPILATSAAFLLDRFHSTSTPPNRFDSNLLDDAYTVFNLTERREVLEEAGYHDLLGAADACAVVLAQHLPVATTDVVPPFGGPIDSIYYATAVLLRALLASAITAKPEGLAEIQAGVLDHAATGLATREGATEWPARSFWGNPAPIEDPYLFVLMPFEARRTEIYERYIKRPIERQLHLKCQRADDIMASTNVMDDVWQHILSADLIVADLTGGNANVFYELGLAHAAGIPVVLVAEDINDIPFDLRQVRTIAYGSSPSGWERLAKQVVQYVQGARGEL